MRKYWIPLLSVAIAAVCAYPLFRADAVRVPSDLRDAVSDSGGESAGAKLDQAFAELKDATGAAGDTPYEILEDLFNKASPARAESVAGWHYTLVARSPETSFFGLNGAAPAAENGETKELRTAPFLYTNGFDLDTPVSGEMLDSLKATLESSPVTVSFPPASMTKGEFSVTFREYKGYVVVKNSGLKIANAKPPFDHPVFYACLVKRLQ